MSKDLGNQEFKAKNYAKAIEFYTLAIDENPTDHTIYGNRSASFHNLKKYNEALVDAEKCIEVKPDWSKGYQRKGLAL
jgi:stress-induced-phosphoprotein 1